MQVFISYAREDKKIARRLYNDLQDNGITAWLDSEKILVGQNWNHMIRKAIKESNFFIALLSSNSISKRGFVQKELKIALDVLDEFPPEGIFVLPVRIDDCKPIDGKLECIHWANLFPSYENGLNQILRVLLPEKNKVIEFVESKKRPTIQGKKHHDVPQSKKHEFLDKQTKHILPTVTQLSDIVLIKYLIKVRKYKIEHIHDALLKSDSIGDFWKNLSLISGKEVKPIKSMAGNYGCDVTEDLNSAKNLFRLNSQQ